MLDNTTVTTNGSALSNLDPILKALGTLEGNNADMSRSSIVMHSRSWNELVQLKDFQQRYLLSSVQPGDAHLWAINNPWADFAPLFPMAKPWVGSLIVNDMNVSRRPLAHMNPLAADDMSNMEAAFRKWAKALTAAQAQIP